MESALMHGEKDATNATIRDLAKTERNFILKKGESTLEGERLRYETVLSEGVLKAIEKAVDKVRK